MLYIIHSYNSNETLTFPGLQYIKRLIFRCIGHECVNLTTFDIFLVGKGSNEVSPGALAIDGFMT